MTTAEATERRRSFHPVAFLLKAGAIAGAIGSITGVLFTFAPGLQTGGDASTTRVSGRIPGTKLHATLTMPNDAVSHMSYRDNLRELGVPLKYSTDDLGQKGIAINYRLSFPGYPKGTRFRIRYDLYRGQTFVRRQLQAIQMDVGSDTCVCRSPFIALPKQDAVYHVVISAFRPRAPFSDPVVHGSTYPFSTNA